MTRFGILRILALALLLTTGQATARGGDAIPGVASDGPRILVMLRIPAPHFRPDRSYAGAWKVGASEPARRQIAEQLAAVAHLRIEAAWPMPDIGVECFVMASTPGDIPLDETVARLALDPRVESVQAVQNFRTLGHNDPLFPVQPAAQRWQLARLHTVATGRGIRVAVIDSGIDLKHPDLVGQVESSANVVDTGAWVAETHGTAVAGIISARADNGVGITGIAPGARLIGLRACWETDADTGQAQCNSFTLAKAIEAALDLKVDIINMSLSGPEDRLLGRLMNVALDRGITIVGASAPVRGVQQFPASHPGVLAVGCEGDIPAPGVFLAPGHDIPAPTLGARWDLVSGASFAAAHVSGLVALLRELDGPRGVLRQSGARYLQPPGLAAVSSASLLQPCALLGSLAHACLCECEAAKSSVH
jgi:subtilisin family serine protease